MKNEGDSGIVRVMTLITIRIKAWIFGVCYIMSWSCRLEGDISTWLFWSF